MCGIVGKIKPSKPEEVLQVLKEGFTALEHRGEDSYGIALFTGERFLFAKAMYLEEFLENLEKEMQERKIDTVKWFIAHNRKRSTGSISIETAHPVWDKEKSIFVIQNGTKREFHTMLSEAVSDTHGILLFYREVRKDFLFRLLEGTGVVFIFDPKEKKILFHKDEERTLFVNKEGIIASEPISSGEWAAVESQDKTFNAEKGFPLKHGEYKHIKVLLKAYSVYCRACSTSKKITVDNDLRCPTCFYFGKEVTRTSSYTLYSGGVT